MTDDWVNDWNTTAASATANNSNNQTSLMDLENKEQILTDEEIDKMLNDFNADLSIHEKGYSAAEMQRIMERKKILDKQAEYETMRQNFANQDKNLREKNPELFQEPTQTQKDIAELQDMMNAIREENRKLRQTTRLLSERNVALTEEIRKAPKTEGRTSPRSSPPRSPAAEAHEAEATEVDPEIEDMLYTRKKATTLCPGSHSADVLTAVKIPAADNPCGFCPRHWNMWKNKTMRVEESNKKKAENEMQRAQREQERHLKFMQAKKTELPKYKTKIIKKGP